jgi:hypothetical protein
MSFENELILRRQEFPREKSNICAPQTMHGAFSAKHCVMQIVSEHCAHDIVIKSTDIDLLSVKCTNKIILKRFFMRRRCLVVVVAVHNLPVAELLLCMVNCSTKKL